MKYLLIILLMATPAFACDPREVVLGKTKTYRILFRGLSKGGNLVEIYRNEKPALGLPQELIIKVKCAC